MGRGRGLLRSKRPISVLVPPTSAASNMVWIIVAPVSSPGAAGTPSRRQILDRYKHVRDDHLRYMQKWGLIRPQRANGETVFGFADLATIRQADAELADGVSFRAVLRSLLASREGQLTFDFRIAAQPAKILQLTRRDPPPLAALLETPPPPEPSSAEQHFAAASSLDTGDPAT